MPVKDFGITLPLAHLVPEFISQFYESPFIDSDEGILLAQMDDLRAWLRAGGSKESELAAEVAEVLLTGESEAKEAAALDGAGPDQLGIDMEGLELDPDADMLDSASLKPVVQLIVEEGDSLQAHNLKEVGVSFSASFSFTLPQPRRHPELKPVELAEKLAAFGGKPLTESLDEDEISGTLNLDLVSEGEAPVDPDEKDTGIVRVALEDGRAGDKSRVQLSLYYPRAQEAYFLASFDLLRQRLLLK